MPVLTLAACSSSGASASATASTTAPASVPFAASSTTTAPSTTVAGAPGGSTPTSGLEMTADMLTHLLATDQGRQLIVAGMASRTGITADQATCFITHVKVETLVALSQMGSTDAMAAAGSVPPDALADLQQGLTTCNIPLDALMPR